MTKTLIDIQAVDYNNIDRDALYLRVDDLSIERGWRFSPLSPIIGEYYKEIAEHFEVEDELSALMDIDVANDLEVIEALNTLSIRIIYLDFGIMLIRDTNAYTQGVLDRLFAGKRPYDVEIYDYNTLSYEGEYVRLWTKESDLEDWIKETFADPVLVDRPEVKHVTGFPKVKELAKGMYTTTETKMSLRSLIDLVPDTFADGLFTVADLEDFKRDLGEWRYADVNDSSDIAGLMDMYSGAEVIAMVLQNPMALIKEDAVVMGVTDDLEFVALNEREYTEEVVSDIDQIELMRWAFSNHAFEVETYIQEQKEWVEANFGLIKGSITLTTGLWD